MSSFVPAPVSAVSTETQAASHEQTRLQDATEKNAATGVTALDTDIQILHAWKLTQSSKTSAKYTHFVLQEQQLSSDLSMKPPKVHQQGVLPLTVPGCGL